MDYKWHLVAGGGNSGYFIYEENKTVYSGDEVVAMLAERDTLQVEVKEKERANEHLQFQLDFIAEDFSMEQGILAHNRADELQRLKGFWGDTVDYFCDSLEMDGCDFEEIAEKYGLIRWEEYDPEKHPESEAGEGDMLWFDALAEGLEAYPSVKVVVMTGDEYKEYLHNMSEMERREQLDGDRTKVGKAGE